MVYAPVGRPFTRAHERRSPAPTVKAWWFNPRDGQGHRDRRRSRTPASATFTPPDAGEMLDWVLVLDDASKKYPPPGIRQ